MTPARRQKQLQADHPDPHAEQHRKEVDHHGAEGRQPQQEQKGGAAGGSQIFRAEQSPDSARLVQSEKAGPVVEISGQERLLVPGAQGQRNAREQGPEQIRSRQDGAFPGKVLSAPPGPAQSGSADRRRGRLGRNRRSPGLFFDKRDKRRGVRPGCVCRSGRSLRHGKGFG